MMNMKNVKQIAIPQQVLFAVKMVMTWWLYVAIILSLIGTVIWLFTVVANVVFPAWVIVPWIMVDILMTMLMLCESISRMDMSTMDMWGVTGVVAIGGSLIAIMISGFAGSGFYSVWTLVYTVGYLVFRIRYGQEKIGQKK